MAKAGTVRCEDPWVQVGACALRHDKTIAAIGYNGPPDKIEIDWSDRERRRIRTIHAEQNCLRRCVPGEILLLATTISPCPSCLNQIAAWRIKEVVYEVEYERGLESFELAKEYGIQLTKIDISEWKSRILEIF